MLAKFHNTALAACFAVIIGSAFRYGLWFGLMAIVVSGAFLWYVYHRAIDSE